MSLRRPTLKRAALMIAAAAFPATTFLAGAHLESRTLEAVFLNVGKADAAFVRPPGTKGFLIDGGLADEYYDAGASVILPFFRWKGVVGLDAAFISHADMDHIGGLFSTLSRVPANVIYYNDCESDDPFLRKTLQTVPKSDARRCVDRFSPSVHFGGAEVRFLSPPVSVRERSGNGADLHLNNSSLCMRIDYGTVSFLFTGDLERAGEEELLNSGVNLRATALKVGHHGSKTSSSESFLQAVQPRYAVISAGAPPYDRGPSEKIVRRLQRLGAEVYWTGRDGAVLMETDGRELKVKTGKRGVK
jgi:competence protein ComEC